MSRQQAFDRWAQAPSPPDGRPSASSTVSNSASSAKKPPAAITLRTCSPTPASAAVPPISRRRRRDFKMTRRPSLEIRVSSLKSNITLRKPSSKAISSNSSISWATSMLSRPWGLTMKASPRDSVCRDIETRSNNRSSDCSLAPRKVHMRLQ